MQTFHSPQKKLSHFSKIDYHSLMRISLVLFLTITFSNVFAKAAGCVDEALEKSNLNPLSVIVSSMPALPDENGNVKVNVEVRGSVYGGLVVLCDINNEFVEIVTPYSEIGQN